MCGRFVQRYTWDDVQDLYDLPDSRARNLQAHYNVAPTDPVNELTRPIDDRMPVVLDKADIGPWLKGEAGTGLLKPAADDRLRMWPVSRRVNKTGSGDDDPTLIDEVAA